MINICSKSVDEVIIENNKQSLIFLKVFDLSLLES